MIARFVNRLALPILLLLLLVNIINALATANLVTNSAADDTVTAITANDLKPPECASLALTGVIVGSGTINGSGSNSLILGSAGVDVIRGRGGNDCVLGGGGNDNLLGGSGPDVLIGGPGADTLNGGGGGGSDVCYGYNGTTGGGGIDTFSGCETAIP